MVASTKTPLGDTTVIQANQFPIKSVKLFSSGGAEITRTFPLSFLRSQDDPHVVEIAHLPSGIQSADVSVSSTSGDVTVLDHYYTSLSKSSRSRNYKLSSQTLRELEAERLRLEDENRLRQQSFTFLTTYMDSLAQCKSSHQPEAAQMVSFFDDFVGIGVTRSAATAELNVKLTGVNNRITEEMERLTKLNNELPVKVVIVLSCKSQVPVEAAEITVSYAVRHVSWKPEYDLHVSMDGNTPSPTVTLDFRCSITQWTGEDWENVNLVLTTADQVSQLIQVPEPKRIDVSLGPTPIPLCPGPIPSHTTTILAKRSDSFRQADPSLREVLHPPPAPPHLGDRGSPVYFAVGLPDRVRRGRHYDDSPRIPAMERSPSVISSLESEGYFPDPPSHTLGLSRLISYGGKDPITHIANGSTYIPSDHASHHVLVSSVSLQAEFMRVTVPSVDTRVYYTCEVKNTSEYVLLPGTVKTYLNKTHVSSTEILNTDLPQVLECSLAVDTSVKTIHNRAPDALPSIGAFSGKATTTYTSAIVVHNTHAEPIRGIIVRNSIPLPADPRITIILREPAGLVDIDEGTAFVKEGCLARWSTTGGRRGKEAGLFEWVCDVNPGTEVLKAVWEVCAPKDLKLSEQVRS